MIVSIIDCSWVDCRADCGVEVRVLIDISQQCLKLFDGGVLLSAYPISSAKNGIGQLINSGCTPLGRHRICQKIGDDLPMNAVLVGRAFTGEIYDESLASQHPQRDWILTRILRLAGVEDGVNKGEINGVSCDSCERYIYIHGTPDSEPMGVPRSHGCIRMRNADVLALYAQVSVGTAVEIVA
ncbi:MAG: L,D-transpeptidase [Moraxella sp.]|nr:L,D-transpeptidase [Moraxella sp.]